MAAANNNSRQFSEFTLLFFGNPVALRTNGINRTLDELKSGIFGGGMPQLWVAAEQIAANPTVDQRKVIATYQRPDGVFIPLSIHSIAQNLLQRFPTITSANVTQLIQAQHKAAFLRRVWE